MPVWVASLVANVAQKVAKRNELRRCLTIRNDSTEPVYYGHTSSVRTTGTLQGIKIDPNGGSLEDEFHKGEVWLIAAAAASVSIIEDVPEIEEIIEHLIKRKKGE